jgi:hypothetical protein
MSSQHSAPARQFRPDQAEHAPAKAELEARGRNVSDYLRACLRWLQADPDAALATLAPHWPPARPYGRPHLASSGEGHREPPAQPGE